MDTTTVILLGGGTFTALAAMDSLTGGHPLFGAALAVLAVLDAAGLAAHLITRHREQA